MSNFFGNVLNLDGGEEGSQQHISSKRSEMRKSIAGKYFRSKFDGSSGVSPTLAREPPALNLETQS